MNSLAVKATLVLGMVLAQGAFSAESDPAALPFTSTAAAGDTNAMGPSIQFDALVYDFGKLVSGQSVRHDFVFTNTGDAVLEILSVHPSCGCTTAGTWTKSVQPGQTGTIPLVFNSGHFNGPIAKTANVICNTKTNQQVRLQIMGTIWKPIEVNPPTAVLNIVADASSNAPVTVRILSSLPEPITLSDPISNNGAFVAEVKTIQPGKEFQLIIKTVGSLDQGTRQGVITIPTSSTNVPTVEVNAFAFVQPAWVIMPPQIRLPPGPLGNAMPCAVSIRNNAAASMTLSEAGVDAGEFPIEIKEVLPGHQFTLTVTFPAGFQVAQVGQANVNVKTSDPKHPVLKVPVLQNPLQNPNQVGLPGYHRGPVPPAPPTPPASAPAAHTP